MAGRLGITMDVACTAMRAYARVNNQKLGDVARSVITGHTSTGALQAGPTCARIDRRARKPD